MPTSLIPAATTRNPLNQSHPAADTDRSIRSSYPCAGPNSICQGRQVATLWPLIFETEHEIAFAHTSFKWANLASHNAGVTVVIVGISNRPGPVRKLFNLTDDGGAVVKEVDNINAYLVAAANITVNATSKPLGGQSAMNFGNMPNEGGHLLLNASQAEEVIEHYGVPRRFIRPFVGSQEFIRGIPGSPENPKFVVIDDSEAIRHPVAECFPFVG